MGLCVAAGAARTVVAMAGLQVVHSTQVLFSDQLIIVNPGVEWSLSTLGLSVAVGSARTVVAMAGLQVLYSTPVLFSGQLVIVNAGVVCGCRCR